MKSPSNWINLQDYLGVNEEMGREMAGNVARQVGDQAGAAQAKLKAGQTAFDTQAAAGNTNAYNPTEGSDAAAMAQQSYTGPSSLGDVDPNLEASVRDAADRVRTAGTFSGQETEVGQAYGGKTASGGLDAFLLSGAGGGAMAELQSKYGSLGKAGYDANEASIATGAAAKKQNEENQALWGTEATKRSDAKAVKDAAAKASSDLINEQWAAVNLAGVDKGLLDAASVFGMGKNQDYGNVNWDGSDKDVYSQMDEAQWRELAGKPHVEQRTWIRARKKQLASGARRGRFVDWHTIK